MFQQRILSITVNNVAGIIHKITGLLIRKGFSIDSLAVSETEKTEVSCMTITLKCDDIEIERAIKQLETLLDVVRVEELNESNSVSREHILIRAKDSEKIIEIIAEFKANIILKKGNAIVIEFTGDTNIANKFVDKMLQEGIYSIARSGKVTVGI